MMNGLMPGKGTGTAAPAGNAAMGHGQNPQGKGSTPAVMSDGGESPNVSPEEQAQYDQFIEKSYELVYDEKVMPKIVERLKGDGDPMENLSNTTAMVVMTLEDKAREQGVKFSPDVVYHGGVEIMEDLANLSKEAGAHEFSAEEVEGAFYQALDLYRSLRQSSGQMNPEDFQDDMNAVVEADRNGNLAEMLPGIEGHFGQQQKKG